MIPETHDLVCAEDVAGELVKAVHVFKRNLGGADKSQALSLAFLELAGYKIKSLIPAGFMELTVAPDQGLENSLRAVDEVAEDEPAFDAGLAAVDGLTVCRRATYDSSFSEAGHKLAADAAERTDGFGFFIRPGFAARSPLDERSGGTDIDTGTAELAARLKKGPVEGCPDHSLGAAEDKRDGRCSPDLVADPDAAAAEDTEVVVAVEERVIPPNVEVAVEGGKADPVYLQGFDDILELAAAVVRTEDTSRDLSDLADGGFVFIAIFLFRADEAGMRVF